MDLVLDLLLFLDFFLDSFLVLERSLLLERSLVLEGSSWFLVLEVSLVLEWSLVLDLSLVDLERGLDKDLDLDLFETILGPLIGDGDLDFVTGIYSGLFSISSRGPFIYYVSTFFINHNLFHEFFEHFFFLFYVLKISNFSMKICQNGKWKKKLFCFKFPAKNK